MRFLKRVLAKALKRRFYHVVFAGINDMGGDKGEDFSDEEDISGEKPG